MDLVKEGDQDVLDLLKGDSALLDSAKKGNLSRVQKLLTPENINCRDSQVRLLSYPVDVYSPFSMCTFSLENTLKFQFDAKFYFILKLPIFLLFYFKKGKEIMLSISVYHFKKILINSPNVDEPS